MNVPIRVPVERVDWFEQTVMGGCPVFTNDQRIAAAFLESKGLRFLVDYGYENCEEKARKLGLHDTKGPIQ